MNQIYHADCFDILKTLPDNSVDAIITDPPYGYLKHKLDCPFDYKLWLDECYRILSKNGLLLFFGRGTIAARWQCYAEDIGFTFKEELVWDKCYSSSGMLAISRLHELSLVYAKGQGKINRIRIDAVKQWELYNHRAIVDSIKRSFVSLKKITTLQELDLFKKGLYNITIRTGKHDITTPVIERKDLSFDTFTAITEGQRFPSILRFKREHYNYQHPTQKPVELFKQLIRLISNENDLILDPFGGSGTTAIACLETNRNYIVIEKDAEYFNVIQNRITDWHAKPKQQELDLN